MTDMVRERLDAEIAWRNEAIRFRDAAEFRVQHGKGPHASELADFMRELGMRIPKPCGQHCVVCRICRQPCSLCDRSKTTYEEGRVA